MTRENKSRYALLGLLSIAPMSGYDVRKAYSQSVVHFWQEGYSQIYPMLRNLADEGLVAGEKAQHEGRPARTVYRILPAGRKALRAWLAAPTEPRRDRNELLLKLFFLRQSGPALGVAHVRRYREELLQTQAQYERIHQELTNLLPAPLDLAYWLITLSQGLHATRALIAWCDETLVVLAELPAAHDHDSGQDGEV